MVQFNTLYYSTLQYNTVRYSRQYNRLTAQVVSCCTVYHSKLLYTISALLHYNNIRYNTLHYSIIQYKLIQYIKVHNSTVH